MKAFLLAAGLGTRLRPITDTVPKCLVPICDKPLLQWWMELFREHGIEEVLINTHYLPNPVRTFIDNNNKTFPVKLIESYENKLIGSGGTVRENKAFVNDEERFLIVYADNLTNINLSELISFHDSHNGILTMALFRTNKPKECGIAALDEERKIVEFVEKPIEPSSNLANAGIYVCNRSIFNYLSNVGFLDFGKDVLPQLIDDMYGWETSDYLIDIGTMENYEKARKEWAEMIYSGET